MKTDSRSCALSRAGGQPSCLARAIRAWAKLLTLRLPAEAGLEAERLPKQLALACGAPYLHGRILLRFEKEMCRLLFDVKMDVAHVLQAGAVQTVGDAQDGSQPADHLPLRFGQSREIRVLLSWRTLAVIAGDVGDELDFARIQAGQ